MSLRDIRKSKGISSGWVAEKLGVSRPTLTNWEVGNHAPSLATQEALARLYDVNMATIKEAVADSSLYKKNKNPNKI